MGQKYVKYSKEFRESALRRLALTPNVAQLCRELGISRQLLYLWRDSARRGELFGGLIMPPATMPVSLSP